MVQVKNMNKAKEYGKALATDSDYKSREGKYLSENLPPERIAQILKRINENFYDREDVLQVVAERILRPPELQKVLWRDQTDDIL